MGSSEAMSGWDWCRVWWLTLPVVSCNPPSLWTGWSCDKWHLDTGPWIQGHDQQSAAGGLHGGSGQSGEADPSFWTHFNWSLYYLWDTDFTSIKETFHHVSEGYDHFITMTVNIIVLYFQLTGNINNTGTETVWSRDLSMIFMQCCRDHLIRVLVEV